MACADHAVRAYSETYGLPVTITNCANNYGPYQFPEKVIPLFVSNALDDLPLPLYASTQNRREWLHALDHCSAIELVLQAGVEGETYNVGSGVEKSIEEIADGVLELTEKPASLKTIVPDRPGHDRRYLLDSSKLRRELGWEPAIDFERGLRETVAWYTENRNWWEPLKGRAPVQETAWR
jgi:dTDP-glucose 4,6-dehydratase